MRPRAASVAGGPAAGPKPSALAAVPPARCLSLDVRDTIRRGEEPLATIMAAVAGLGPDQVLVLRVPFEPIPLYRVLAGRGFAHWTERSAADDWAVWFYRGEPTDSAAACATTTGGTLDVRGLEPPQPMVAVLARIETLAPGETLTVVHDRRPTFLYPQLDERGFTHRTDEPEAGVIRIIIERPGP